MLKHHPQFNLFIRGRKLVILDDVTISVLIEREIAGENVPDPIGIKEAQNKTYFQINKEIREAKQQQVNNPGSLSNQTWIRFIPGFLLKLVIQLADKNISMARKYGKVTVAAVGMYGKGPIWFIPHGTATVLVTIGGIDKKWLRLDVSLFQGSICA